MNSAEIASDGRSPARRWLTKQEAIRHLIHAAIRLIMKMEDPFAVHLLIHSADKMVGDLAKKTGKELRFDWELYIKDEYHAEFFQQHRETYNYFKHANKDLAHKLPVRNIAMLNIMTLFICINNYAAIFESCTHHMYLFIAFTLCLDPRLINPNKPESESEAAKIAAWLHDIAVTQSGTPSQFFEAVDRDRRTLPDFHLEKAKDLEDVIGFYNLSFAEIRIGKNRRRITKMPES